MKSTEQYFPVVLFITLYKVILTFETECLQTRNWEFSLLGRLTNKQQDSKEVLT